MAQWLYLSVNGYIEAIQAVFQTLSKGLDPRKCLWCNYPVFWHERDELEEKVSNNTRKLEKEVDDELSPSKLWYVGIPEFRLIRRGVPHLVCEIDLYYVALNVAKGYTHCWYGKLVPKADKFDFPVHLIDGLATALSQGQAETNDARIVERANGYSVYEYLGREWKIPDAFLGFIWALREKGSGFEGLLDSISCILIDKSVKELPSPQISRLNTGNYDEIVSALRNLGWNKTEAEQRASYVLEKYPDASLEEKLRYALNG